MDATTTAFEAERPRLRSIAARILGSESEADDVLQEAWLRLDRTDGIDDPPAWLTTAVTRLCLDQMRKRSTRSQFELEAGGRSARELDGAEPEGAALLDAKVSDAIHVVIDTLTPVERVTFVLHDLFAFPFDEIGTALGRSSTAVRQLASRARRKAHHAPEPPEETKARDEHRRVVDAFLTAARGGDMSTLLTLLAPDAIMVSDLIAQKLGSDPIYDGPAAVAARLDGAKGALPAMVDGELGAAWFHERTIKVAFAFHVHGGLVTEVELIADPEVLATLAVERQSRRMPASPV